jgi:hypothetical protein
MRVVIEMSDNLVSLVPLTWWLFELVLGARCTALYNFITPTSPPLLVPSLSPLLFERLNKRSTHTVYPHYTGLRVLSIEVSDDRLLPDCL